MIKVTLSYGDQSIIDTTNDCDYTMQTSEKFLTDNVGISFQSGSFQSKSKYPLTYAQSVTPDSGYDGLSSVYIYPVTTTNLTAANILNGVTVKVGDTVDNDRIKSVTGTAPKYTLLASKELTVSTTSTSAASAGTVSAGTDAWTKDKIIYVRIRDKAGKRAGYFYGSDVYFINFQAANESTTTLTQASRLIHRYSSSNAWTTYCAGTTTGYGVYGHSITSDGTVNIYHRYNSTYSLTIDGTYTVEVYSLDFPNLISPFA